MDIQKKLADNMLTVALSGRLDSVSAPELQAALEGLRGVTELVFDFSELRYISSAGLRVLLTAQKTMSSQGHMAVRGAGPSIREVFDLTGFSDILTLE